MKRFKKILFVHDSSEQDNISFKRAADLAKRNQAQLTVVNVIEEIPRDYQMLITALMPQEIKELAGKNRNESLERYIYPFREAGLRLNAKVLVGKEFIEIIKEVQRNSHDLVIKTARGESGVKDILFGSTAMHLMRKCPCPVWMMKPGQSHPYDRILAAVDVAPADAEGDRLKTKIMDLASSLAHLELSELHIVYVWDYPYESYLNGQLGISLKDIKKWEIETHKLQKTYLDDFLKKFVLNNVKYQVHLLKGQASDLIPQLAENRKIDLIVMGTLCRTGISGFFMGNTAEKVLHRVNCSVLTVKPEGFVSPVTINEE